MRMVIEETMKDRSKENSDEEETEESEDDEGDEVDDSEDFVDDKEYVSNNAVKNDLQRQSLGNGNKKIVLKKATSKKPSIQEMVDEAIKELNERRGSSSEAIKKFIMNKNPDMMEDRLKNQIKRYLKNCLIDGTMMQIKRSFKLTNKHNMKIKQMEREKRKAKMEKEKEKQKKQKENMKQKNAEKKAANKEKSIPKLEDKPKAVNKSKEGNIEAENKPAKLTKSNKSKAENLEAENKPAKITKSVVSTKTAESKNMKKQKSKSNVSRKSVSLAIKPKTMKHSKTPATAPEKQIISPQVESAPVAATSTAVKAIGRGNRNK